MAPEIQAVLEAVSAWQALIWIGAIIALIVGLRKAWPSITQFVATINALASLPAHIAETTATLAKQNSTLAQIKHEVLPNSGGSLRDAVDRQGKKQAEQGLQIDGIESRLVKDYDRLKKHDERLDELDDTRPNKSKETL